MHSLPVFLRLAGQPILLIGDGEAAYAKARLIEGAGGVIVRARGAARLAFVALDDPAAAAAVAAELKAVGVLVNVVDRPGLCDFTVPAIVDRGTVLVAVGTGGASASLAKALRERLEAWLPPGLGALADAIFAARATVAATHPTVATRRRLWDAALAAGGPLDPLAEHADPAATIATLGTAQAIDRFDEINLVSLDADELTLRQARLLAQVDTLYHAADLPADLLDRARRDAVRVVCAAPPAMLPPGRSVWLRWLPSTASAVALPEAGTI